VVNEVALTVERDPEAAFVAASHDGRTRPVRSRSESVAPRIAAAAYLHGSYHAGREHNVLP